MGCSCKGKCCEELVVKVSRLMTSSGVTFGTSGARGLAREITDQVAYAYTRAFLQHLAQEKGQLGPNSAVAIAGDLRPSTERIMQAAAQAVLDSGLKPINCGKIPSPAAAYYGFEKGIPGVMVTGSHIPEDRNGIKYTRKDGEITKHDEAGIREQSVCLPKGLFNDSGMLKTPPADFEESSEAYSLYRDRYLRAFPRDFLSGKTIGLYQHSAVGRDVLAEIYRGLGAEVTELGRSDEFIPVDTEAIREEDRKLAKKWASEEHFDTIVSTDGDSDRPLMSDETGTWIRGDISGILTAQFLSASRVATPVSCNSAVELSGAFQEVVRTRIGSPYVIAGMQEAQSRGEGIVVGYEANGGFLIQSDVCDGKLKALPTRDAVIVHLALLGLAKNKNMPLSALVAELPERVTASDRLKEFPTEKSKTKLAELSKGLDRNDSSSLQKLFGPMFGEISTTDQTDGLRITFSSGDIVHLRPSGNAPEFRCYTEASSVEKAEELLKKTISLMEQWRSE